MGYDTERPHSLFPLVIRLAGYVGRPHAGAARALDRAPWTRLLLAGGADLEPAHLTRGEALRGTDLTRPRALPGARNAPTGSSGIVDALGGPGLGRGRLVAAAGRVWGAWVGVVAANQNQGLGLGLGLGLAWVGVVAADPFLGFPPLPQQQG